MADIPINVNDVPTIRILMLGDQGVGKTRVTNLMATTLDTPSVASRSVSHSNWNIQVRLHEYPNVDEVPPVPSWATLLSRPPPPKSAILYFIEFIDINSQFFMQSEQSKNVVMTSDGIVLVHNLRNMRSHDNLHDWLYEPLRLIGKNRHGRRRFILKPEHVPILVVGTRLDKMLGLQMGRSSIAHQLNAEEILLNTLDTNSFADKSRNQNKLYDFFNTVVDFKEFYPKLRSYDL